MQFRIVFSIPFAYTVAPDMRAEFEAVYGPEGRWGERIYASERRLPPT